EGDCVPRAPSPAAFNVVTWETAELRSAGQVWTSFDFAPDRLCPYVVCGNATWLFLKPSDCCCANLFRATLTRSRRSFPIPRRCASIRSRLTGLGSNHGLNVTGGDIGMTVMDSGPWSRKRAARLLAIAG